MLAPRCSIAIPPQLTVLPVRSDFVICCKTASTLSVLFGKYHRHPESCNSSASSALPVGMPCASPHIATHHLPQCTLYVPSSALKCFALVQAPMQPAHPNIMVRLMPTNRIGFLGARRISASTIALSTGKSNDRLEEGIFWA